MTIRKNYLGAPLGTEQPCIKDYFPGSVKNVWVIPLYEIDEFLYEGGSSEDWNDVIIVRDGYELKSYYFSPNTVIFTETGKDSPSGTYYEQKLQGFRPGNEQEVYNEIDRLHDGYYIVIMEMWNQRTRIWGTPLVPVQFIGSTTSGRSKTNPSGSDWNFYSRSTGLAPAITTPPLIQVVIPSPCERISNADFIFSRWVLDNGVLKGIKLQVNPNGLVDFIQQYKSGILKNENGIIVDTMTWSNSPLFAPNSPMYLPLGTPSPIAGWKFEISDLPVVLKTGQECAFDISQTFDPNMLGAYSPGYSDEYN